MQPGVILDLSDESDIPKTKPVIELLDPQPALDPKAIELVNWLSETYLAPIGVCVWLMLPPGFTGKSDRLYRFVRDELQDEPPSANGLARYTCQIGPATVPAFARLPARSRTQGDWGN